MKRQRPSWDETFMFQALWVAARSSCNYLQTGAVIVQDKRVISSGYNGAPPGIENCLDRGCRKDSAGIDFEDKGKSVCRGTHAEPNAMAQIPRKELKGTIIYTLYFPCSSCAKIIAGNGLAEVVYSEIYKELDSLTKEIFSEAGIALRQYRLNLNRDIRIIRNIFPTKN